MTAPDRRGAPLRGAIAGALVFAPLGLWILYRLLPFNDLGFGSRLMTAMLFVVVYAGIGFVAGAAAAFVLTRLRGLDERGYLSAALSLGALVTAWFVLGRIRIGLPPTITALLAAAIVVLVLWLAARFLVRHRGGATAVVIATFQIVVLGLLVFSGGGKGARSDEEPLVAQLEPQPPLVVFALDGVEWNILRPLLESGAMPHMESIHARAATAPFQSMEPTWSPPLWTTMWTGKLPEEHGITFFLVDGVYRLPLTGARVIVPRLLGAQRVADRLMTSVEAPVTSRQRRATAVWEAMGLADLRSVLANRLVSWPALPLEGIELSTHLLHGDASVPELTYPPELAGEALRRIGEAAPVADPALEPVPWLARGLAEERVLWEMAAELAVAQQSQLVILYTHLIDSAQHRYLKYHWPDRFNFEVDPDDVARFGKVVDATHRHVDAMIGGVLARLPADARVLVISDHGVAPNLELVEDVPEPEGQQVMMKAETKDVSGVHGHAPDGIFLLAGPGVRPGPLQTKPHVLDVAPLILNLVDLPAAMDMEHDSLLDREPGLVSGLALQDPIATYEGWTRRAGGTTDSALDERVLEELRALGYID